MLTFDDCDNDGKMRSDNYYEDDMKMMRSDNSEDGVNPTHCAVTHQTRQTYQILVHQTQTYQTHQIQTY